MLSALRTKIDQIGMSAHHKIVWHDTGFVGKQICSSSFIGLEHWTRGENGYVVIGNIYENPELLEQANES
jgi:hypothetical protein